MEVYNREISLRCFSIPFNIWIPVNTLFDRKRQNLFSKQMSSSHFAEIKPFFLRIGLNVSVFTNRQDLLRCNLNTFVSSLALNTFDEQCLF